MHTPAQSLHAACMYIKVYGIMSVYPYLALYCDVFLLIKTVSKISYVKLPYSYQTAIY